MHYYINSVLIVTRNMLRHHISCHIIIIIMTTLRSICGHYIFALWFHLLLLFSSPNLSGRRLDVYHTSTHGVAFVRI